MSDMVRLADQALDQPLEWFDDDDTPELSDAETVIVERFGADMFGGEEDTVGRYWADVHGVQTHTATGVRNPDGSVVFHEIFPKGVFAGTVTFDMDGDSPVATFHPEVEDV
jgi:hypothetical protein